MNLFWDYLPRPFFALAPMEDVTDTVFRQIVASVGRPDVFFTEFTHVDAILHGDVQRLKYSVIERPIVAQIWGTDPKSFFKAAQVIKQLKFDGIDINLGCPERKIVKQGACAALIGQNAQVAEIIAATSEAGLPVSVKTRLGIKDMMTEDWVGFLLTKKLSAITIHGRTAMEMSAGPAHWDEITKAITLRNSNSNCKIIGNGDVKDLLSAKHLALSTGVDGIMIGRGIFENVAVFADSELSSVQRLELFKKHIILFEKTWGKTKNFQILKKFAKTYIHGFDSASELREKVAATKNIAELLSIIS